MTLPATLDVTKRQTVHYCVPTYVRDFQIKQSSARIKERIQPYGKVRRSPIAIVGFGPSLADTWEQVKRFKYVFSCSGAHKFLVEHGIVPTWHCDVDPRAHKATLLGTPQRATTYLIASACHKALFDLLDGFTVKLWHIFDATKEGIRLLPPGEYAVTGGCDAGLRAMTLAGFLGFRDLHVFGMDGCGRPESGSHAAAHPNAVKKYASCEYGGKTYQTTPALLEAARQVWHELDQMPSVRATFYGDGLIQAMAKDYKPKKVAAAKRPFESIVAFAKPELISAEYRDLNKRLHEENVAYGVGGGKHAPTVLKLAATLAKPGVVPAVLDYGCGKSMLQKALPFPIFEYDPAVPGKEESPRPADLVVCSDVLEHIEPSKLNFVLDDLRRCTKQVGYFVISTRAATKFLADGRNTHLIQRNLRWWQAKLKKFFTVGKIIAAHEQLHVVVGPKGKAA